VKRPAGAKKEREGRRLKNVYERSHYIQLYGKSKTEDRPKIERGISVKGGAPRGGKNSSKSVTGGGQLRTTMDN